MIDIAVFRQKWGGFFNDETLYPDTAILDAYEMAVLVQGRVMRCWSAAARSAGEYALTAHYLYTAILDPSSPVTVSAGVGGSASMGSISVSDNSAITASLGVAEQEYSKDRWGLYFLELKEGSRTMSPLMVLNKKKGVRCGC